jgi:hypothetical protein
MATVVSNPVKAWVATLTAGGFVSHGTGAGRCLTLTIALTQGWEIQVPLGVRYGSNVSLATQVNILPSSDGGTNFDSAPLFSFSIPTLASANQVYSVRLTTGIYVIQMVASSPSTTFFALTQEVTTAVANV